jgi:carbon storage regulator CsrA
MPNTCGIGKNIEYVNPVHLIDKDDVMLIITRKINETIKITDDIVIKVIRVNGCQVKLGIQAPSHIKVERHDKKTNNKNN